jgi:predicted glycosyltransferase
VLGELGLDRARPVVVVRTPPSVSLYHRFENDLFAQVLLRLRDDPAGPQVVVLPRVAEQRDELVRAGGFVVPDRVVDAQSLVAFADLVISAGGTMNREAVALGTPVYTTFEGRPGAVDDKLIAEGRLRRLTSADEIAVQRRPPASGERVRRDPRELLALALAPLQHASRQAR